jgi:hypothetical protein
MRYTAFILISSLLITCSKKDSTNNSDGLPHFDETFQIHFTIDGKNYSRVFGKDSTSPVFVYNRETGPGYLYFARGCHINFSTTSVFRILLGSAKGSFNSNWQGAYESFKSLMSIGTKMYDSIQFCTQLQTNRVEITYVDENKDIWSSTKWTFVNDTLIKKLVDQPGGSFEITEYTEVSLGNNRPNNTAIIKGVFSCTLYKADTNEKRSLTNGIFTILVGM